LLHREVPGDPCRLRGDGLDELAGALQIGRRHEDLARAAGPGRFPRARSHVRLSVVAGDSLGPQKATDRLSLHPVAYNSEPNHEHHIPVGKRDPNLREILSRYRLAIKTLVATRHEALCAGRSRRMSSRR
jgi:hypothetical protein